MGREDSRMTFEQIAQAKRFRMYAYILWGSALFVALYTYFYRSGPKAYMSGYMSGCAANMSSGTWKRAKMCGSKAEMCGMNPN